MNWTTCRYCGQDADPALDRPICTACHDLFQQHRTEQGIRDCEICGHRMIAIYECVGCGERLHVPGQFVWGWQGKSHYHRADDQEKVYATMNAHGRDHDGVWIPRKERHQL